MGTRDKDYWQQKGKGHRERLRKKYSEVGLDGFTDVETLEFLLTLGTPRRDVKEIAKELLKTFGSISSVIGAPKEKLKEIKGIGDTNVLYIKLIHDVAARYLRDKMRSMKCFNNSKEVFEYLIYTMKGQKREIFKVLLLNTKNQLIHEEDLFQGSIRESPVYPREIMALALQKNSAALIFVHNHPSGDPNPSSQDKDITRRLVYAGSLLDIRVLDHIIIGTDTYFSFADYGLVEEYKREYESRIRP